MDNFLWEIQNKWQKIWEDKKIFEANADPNRKKFFITAPYPYMSGFLHLGHGTTYTRADILARYKRLKGLNVLFPLAFHVTGSPIVSKTQALQNNDQKIIKELLEEEIPLEEIEKLKDPKNWINYFITESIKITKKLGLSIDYRRQFTTSYLHPWYNKFIEWQYRKLNSKNYIIKGEHPIVWDPIENIPIGDHDRPDDYAGIGPSEGYIIKFVLKDDNIILPAFTLRPETIYGVTNIWVREDIKYRIYNINNEKYLLPDNDIIYLEFKNQKFNIEKTDYIIEGKDLIGKKVINPINKKEIYILPASFVDDKIGTGIVMSVPAHAPYDYIALKELVDKNIEIAKEAFNNITSLFKLEGFSDIPARDIIEKYNIKDQNDKKLEEATQDLYSKEYYNAITKDIYGKYSNKKIYEIKDLFAEDLIKDNISFKYYTLPIRFKSRYGNFCIVKIIDNQWFLKYSDENWKKLAHDCIDNMNFYPEEARNDFHSKIDWLKDWPCAHESKKEIGTFLPWDKEWVIESLSDSTIYMAFYTIAHLIKNIDPNKIEDDLFDYLFLNIGDENKLVQKYGDIIKDMKKEFEYWYPVDLRNSGKDLIPNHLSFFIFHHVAIFDKKYWPRGISINGFVVDKYGQKMSKSKGNYISLRKALNLYPADIIRYIIAMKSDASYNDVSFDLDLSSSIESYLISWYKFSIDNYEKGDEEYYKIDEWFENVLNKHMKNIEEYYEKLDYKSIINEIYNLDNNYNWYFRRRNNSFNKNIIKRYILYKTLSLYPIVPHISSEILEKIGKDPFDIRWPEELKYDNNIIDRENYIKNLRDDIIKITIMRRIKDISIIKIIVASKEKYNILEKIKNNDIKDIDNNILNKLRPLSNININRELEIELLNDSKQFLENEFKCKVIISEEENENDPKKDRALPYKPAIIIQ